MGWQDIDVMNIMSWRREWMQSMEWDPGQAQVPVETWDLVYDPVGKKLMYPVTFSGPLLNFVCYARRRAGLEWDFFSHPWNVSITVQCMNNKRVEIWPTLSCEHRGNRFVVSGIGP